LAGNYIPVGIAALNGMVVACACFVIYDFFSQKQEAAQSAKAAVEGNH
jgi:hypothetical protein